MVLAGLLLGAAGPLKPPTPASGPSGGDPQAHAQPKPPDTKDNQRAAQPIASVPADQLRAKQINREAKEKAAKEQASATNERWTAIGTVGSGIFTGLLLLVALIQAGFFWWQLALIKVGTDDASLAARAAMRSADAAKLSADAAVAVEMPILVIASPELLTVTPLINLGQTYSGSPMETKAISRYIALPEIRISNHGRTNAILIRGEVGWQISPRPRGDPTYDCGISFNQGSIVKANSHECLQMHVPILFDDIAFAKTTDPQNRLWVYIAIHYLDFLKRKQEARFCWRWGCPDGTGLYYLVADDDAPEPYTRHT